MAGENMNINETDTKTVWRSPEEEPPRKRKVLPLVITFVVAAAVLFLGGFLFFGGSFTPPDENLVGLESKVKAELGQLENKSNEEIEAALNEVIEEGMIRVSINMNPVFPDGASEGTLQIENHPNNHYNLRCVITADTNGDGVDEEIYHSGLMPVNSHIQTDVLGVDLEKGEYDAVATFKAYDVDTDAEIGVVVAQIRVSVLN